MPLYVLLQENFLIKRTRTHRASILELLMHYHVLIEMGHLEKFLLANIALVWKTQTVRFQMLMQMCLLFKCFVRTLGAEESTEAAVQKQMLI